MSEQPTKQIGVRLPLELIARVDSYAERLLSELPGTRISRSDVIRTLLLRALDAIDGPVGRPMLRRHQTK